MPTSPKPLPPCFELKSANLGAVALVLKTDVVEALSKAMEAQFGNHPQLFSHDPVVIDLSHLREVNDVPFEPLLALLRAYKMLPVAVRGGTANQLQAAHLVGLSEAAPELMAASGTHAAPEPAPPEQADQSVAPTRVHVPTMVIDKPLRSGQQVYARHGDLIVLAAVNFGAEVLADGHIHVYGPLRGKAVAGVKGNSAARIFSTCMEPELVSIAGVYRTTEVALPQHILGQPAQIWLNDARLMFEPLLYTPRN